MRRQGTIVEWHGTEGFGFLQCHGGNERAFAHISDFTERQPPPAVGDLVSYDVVNAMGRSEASAIAHMGAAPVARWRWPR